MTVSAPVYSARIVGTPDIPVSIREDSGKLTLDSSRTPHVTGTVSLAVEDAAMLADLDPRENRRMVVEAGGRSFDLGIREANPNRADSTVEVQLASDEAILGDFAQLVEDATPFALASSLRAVVEYVLQKAIPGVSLAPSEDADMTPYWSVTNLLRNPAVRGTLNNWSPGGGCSLAYVSEGTTGAVRVTPTSPAGAVFAVDTSKYNLNASPGDRYTFEVAALRESTGGMTLTPVLRFLDVNNATIVDISGAEYVTTTQYGRFSVQATAPANAVRVAPYVRFVGSTGRVIRLDAGILHTSRFPVPHFTGSDVASAHYTFTHQGEPDDSPSVRTPTVERDPEALVWAAGVSGLSFLAPLVQAAGFRLVCNERREWTLRDAEYREPGAQTFRYGVNIIAADEQLSRSADEWFDGAVYRYEWTDADNIQQVREDAYALSSSPSKVILREIRSAYPGPGRAQYAVQRAQGKGRTVTATKQATWAEAAEQSFSATLDGTPIQVGIAEKVEFDLSTNQVTTTSRTTDTPAGAIKLLNGTIDALPGTIDSL